MLSIPYSTIRGAILATAILALASPLWAQSGVTAPAVDPNTISRTETSESLTDPKSDKVIADKTTIATKPVPAKRSKQASSDEWNVSFSPYLFLSGVRGTIGARGRSIEVDSSFGSVAENLDFGLMGTLEAKKGKFFFLNDLMWIRMSADRNTPGGLFTNAKIGANMVIIDPEAGYRLAESKAGSLDLMGGARIWSVENTLTVTAGTQPGFGESQRKTFVAPVIGARAILNLAPRLFLVGKVDVGAGSGTDSTSQFFGGAGFRIKPKIALVGGYRYLQVDHSDDSGFIFDTRMTGLMLGAKFSF